MKDIGIIGDQVIVKEFKINTDDSGETITARTGTIVSRYKEFEVSYDIHTEEHTYGRCLNNELYVILFDDGSVERGFVREELTRCREYVAHGAEKAR